MFFPLELAELENFQQFKFKKLAGSISFRIFIKNLKSGIL